jgi:CheY-like chemotaxis protein
MSPPLRVLIAEDTRAQLLIMKRMLTKEGIEVVDVEDGLAAQKKLAEERFDVAVLDWMLPGIDGIEIARRVATQAATRPRLIVTSVIDMPMAREHALAAGADAFLPKPLAAKEFLDCIRAKGANGPLPPFANASASHPVARAKAWAELPTSMGDAFGEFVQAQAVGDLCDQLPRDPTTRHVCCSLVDAARGCELWMAFLARDADAKALTSKMLEDPDPSGDDTQGMLAEVANVLVGVAKTAFHPEDYNFTIGLPGSSSAEDLNLALGKAAATITFRLRIAEATIYASVAVRAKGPADKPVTELCEGHILAEDVRLTNGALLLPAGTRLTESAVNRLRDVLEGKSVRIVS